MFIIYLLIGLLTTMIGSMAGISGGVIMKPVLDMFGHFDLATIGVLSGGTVLAMSSMSILMAYKQGKSIEFKQGLLISLGSITGGTIGKEIFNQLLIHDQVAEHVGWIQSTILVFILVIIFLFMRYKDYITTLKLQNPLIVIGVGMVLGFSAAFLGIGGGPLNVAVLVLLFSMDVKKAALNSIFIIFFAQLSGILVVLFTTDLSSYDLSMLPFMLVGGVSGGLIGSRIRPYLSVKHVGILFNVLIISIIFINIYNIIQYL
ncbi:hypothetical protein SAMN05421734_10687 [Pelagirhabdus alkalitolerans]|uniref:Probable membrane transporter protein n=1 Tax=Pelagirhabdus alkalitolerans TaxID=1612202 RepID=A0A1G6KGS6_9BACI|nr:sulfite exporter TauE/SafE family protein [Pelagirhabdus alkalitolerans]SDC30173.1 hypothetical protein SAMN05421734_10687 [Pelagirhabdus alkalitolerans]